MAEKTAGRVGARRPPPPDSAWAWFFDIDGTLVELASSPSSVVVHDDLPQLIKKLHALSGGAVSFVTGRPISDVDRLLPVQGIAVAGQHGFEFRDSNGDAVSTGDVEADFVRIQAELDELVARHPGLLVEFKGGSIALHYRKAPKLAGYAHRVMKSLQSRHAPGMVVQKGKRVAELRAAGTDKGMAIAALMELAPFKGRTPVFVGDDVTDEAGFEYINLAGGHSIKVGRGRTAAKYRLLDVNGVREWLASAVSPVNYE